MLTIEIIIVLFAFTKSFFAGVLILAFVVVMEKRERKGKFKVMDVEWDTHAEAGFQEPKKTCNKFIIYKNCNIEDFGEYYLISEPSGERLRKTFYSMEEAKARIDRDYADIQPVVRERRRVHNVRFVR